MGAARRRREWLEMKAATEERAASGMDEDIDLEALFGDKQEEPEGGGYKRPSERLLDAETEKKLDEWVEAKRRRDYEVADRIRAELKAAGVDAATERPQKGKGKGKDKK